MDKNKGSRDKILSLCRDYVNQQPAAEFVPGKTYIPPSGKVLDDEDLVSLVNASLDMWLTAGRFANKFESRLAKFSATERSLLTCSGSSANLLAFTSLTSHKLSSKRIPAGSDVLTVAAGFPTTVSPIIQNQCRPVFVDIDIPTYNIDVNKLEQALTPKTRAIILAHTLGNPFDLDSILAFAKKHNLWLIEDCCDALGSTYKQQHVGSFGDLATLSFYPAHHITMGEGGAIFSKNNSLMDIVASFRDWGRDCYCPPGKDNTCKKRFCQQFASLPHGYDHKYTYSHIGYNMKVTDMQASIGCSQLEKAPSFIEKRRKNFRFLKNALIQRGLEEYFILPEATANADPSWFGFPISIREHIPLNRCILVQELEKKKIGTRLLFAGNLTRQPAFDNVDYLIQGSLENTDKVMRDSFWIGIWPGLDQQRLLYMADTMQEVVQSLLKSTLQPT